MVQVVHNRFDGVPEFASVSALMQPWSVLLTDAATSPELFACEYALAAVHLECDARREAELGFSWLQKGKPHFAFDWFTYMSRNLEQAIGHWTQVAQCLNEQGFAEHADLYQPLLYQVMAQQQRLSALAGRLQGQVARYCQEWNITWPLSSEVDEGDGYGNSGATD